MLIRPDDTTAWITAVDREGNKTLLPKSDTPIRKYDLLLERAFPAYRVINLTEFDYGRAYRYSIVLSRDEDAAALEVERVRRFVREEGKLEVVNIAISTLAPYI